MLFAAEQAAAGRDGEAGLDTGREGSRDLARGYAGSCPQRNCIKLRVCVRHAPRPGTAGCLTPTRRPGCCRRTSGRSPSRPTGAHPPARALCLKLSTTATCHVPRSAYPVPYTPCKRSHCRNRPVTCKRATNPRGPCCYIVIHTGYGLRPCRDALARGLMPQWVYPEAGSGAADPAEAPPQTEGEVVDYLVKR